jgi:hypothetical protein
MRRGVTILNLQESQQACNGDMPLHPDQRKFKSQISTSKVMLTVFFGIEGLLLVDLKSRNDTFSANYQMLHTLTTEIQNKCRGELVA